MSDGTVKTPAREKPSLFVEGYLNDRFASGHRPTYGYPPSPLPDAGGRVMEVVTSLASARRRKTEAS